MLKTTIKDPKELEKFIINTINVFKNELKLYKNNEYYFKIYCIMDLDCFTYFNKHQLIGTCIDINKWLYENAENVTDDFVQLIKNIRVMLAEFSKLKREGYE